MRDRSRSHTVASGLNLVAYSSLAVIGIAATLSGIVISGITIYRSAISRESQIPESGTPQITESTKFDANSLVCFKINDTAVTPPESESANSIILPQELFKLDFPELENKITSSGERILIQEETTIPQSVENYGKKVEDFRIAKREGIEQYAAGQYQTAINRFKAARTIHKNSPETLIYLNNALANQSSRSYGLAVTVSLQSGEPGSGFNTAMAVLRGAAQAQDDINKAGGIQGVPLKLLIVNDFANSPQSAETVAQMLVKQQNILGVVGHNASKATLAARRVYANSGLTSISPTSTSAELPPGNTFGFRTVPNDIIAVEKIGAYLLAQNRSQVAVFYTEDNEKEATGYSEPVKERFETFINNNIPNGQVVKSFNLSDLDSDKSEFLINSLEQLISSGAIDTIMLLPSHSDKSIANALKVGTLSRQLSDSILIIGNNAMYDSRISKCGDQVNKLVAVSFWDMNFARTSISSIPLEFADRASSPDQANSLWDTDIHWLSAMAYDAILTFGKALDENHPSPTRTGIGVSLAADRFSIDGATGIVKFDNNGDRIGHAKLVKLLPTDAADQDDERYDFQPIFSE